MKLQHGELVGSGKPPDGDLSYGIITPTLAALFRLLAYVSPLTWIRRATRAQEQLEDAFQSDRVKVARSRSRFVDRYVIGWLLIEVILIVTGDVWRVARIRLGQIPVAWLAVVLAIVRLIDIVQVAINLTFFDIQTLRKDVVASVQRVVILTFINYAEVAVMFAVLYASMLPDLRNANSVYDALYFSIVTQLTIGYGDVQPTGAARVLVTLQGGLAFVFAVLLISRLLAFLPPIIGVEESKRDQQTSKRE